MADKLTSIEIHIPDDQTFMVRDSAAMKAALIAEAKKHIVPHGSPVKPGATGPEDKFRVSLNVEPI